MSKHMRQLAILLVLVPTVTLAALQQNSRSHDRMMREDPNWAGLMGSMERMHAVMASVKRSGDNDVDFVKLMLPHHRAAIDMAKTELMYGKDPQMRRLAQQIITDQQSEIELMQLWLKQRDARTSKPGTKSNSSQ